MSEEILQRQMKMLMSKQFFELGKYLANLQQMQETQKLIDIGAIEAKYIELRDKAAKKHKGEILDDMIDEYNKEEEAEIEKVKIEIQDKLNQEESQMREEQQTRFHDDKKNLVERNHNRRRARIQGLINKYQDKDQPTLVKVGNKLINRLDKTAAEI